MKKRKLPRNSITYLKEVKRGGPNLKRGQKNAKRKFYSNKKGNLYVPKDKRENLRSMSFEIFGSRNRYSELAYEMGIDLEKITEMLEEAYAVKVNLLKERLDNAVKESNQARSTEADDATPTTTSDDGNIEST